MFGSSDFQLDPAFTQQINVPPPQPKGGMFAGGNLANILTSAAAGFLSRRSPQLSQSMLQAMQLKQQQAAEEAQYQAHHSQDLQDQYSLLDYKQAHQGPDDLTQRVTALNTLEPGLGTTYAHNYAVNGGGMGPVLVNPMTGQTMMPAGKAPAQSPPAEAVARLRSNPAEAAQFDEIFGPGASSQILGGQTASPSGNFPR